MLGAHAFPSQWVQPFEDTLDTAIFGYNLPKISELARSGVEVAHQILDRTTHPGVSA